MKGWHFLTLSLTTQHFDKISTSKIEVIGRQKSKTPVKKFVKMLKLDFYRPHEDFVKGLHFLTFLKKPLKPPRVDHLGFTFFKSA